ncbi:hypothetical protein KR018_010715, partial [Drosophila ironensis]
DPKPCKYGDGECILQFINKMFSERSAVGDPNLNLKKLDPLQVDTMTISQGADKSPVAINLKFTNNLIYGIRDLRAVKVKGFGKDLTGNHECRGIAKTFSMVGPYTITGKVLILPISGAGQSNITISNMKAIIRWNGKVVEKNGERYMDISDFKLSMKPESIQFHFGNLFNGDKALGDNMNKFLNENSEAIYKETGSAIEAAFGKRFAELVKDVFSSRPYDSLFAEE